MFKLRSLTQEDLPAALRLSRAEGWPHRSEDWRGMLALGKGLTIASSDDLIGTVLWWEQNTHATLGMVIVATAHRGRGHGARLVAEAVAQIGHRNILLHATDAGQPGYAKLGFSPIGRIHQHLGPTGKMILPDVDLDIAYLPASDIGRITGLDRAARGWDRMALLSALMETGTCHVATQNGQVSGYALQRRAGRGTVIGPIVADGVETARALVSHILRATQDTFVRIDSDPRLGLCDWLHDIGLPQVGTGTTMVRGTLPSSAATAPKLYGLISQAYG